MTREEAKEILTHNWTRVDNPNYSESELDEAFFMAIEALQIQDICAEMLESAKPASDVVSVVRCKDCMYYIDGGCESNDMWQSLYGESGEVESINRHPDDFCSYGVRREDGEA